MSEALCRFSIGVGLFWFITFRWPLFIFGVYLFLQKGFFLAKGVLETSFTILDFIPLFKKASFVIFFETISIWGRLCEGCVYTLFGGVYIKSISTISQRDTISSKETSKRDVLKRV